MEAKAPLEFPAFQTKAKTRGTKAPVAKKSDPIQAMRNIEREEFHNFLNSTNRLNLGLFHFS